MRLYFIFKRTWKLLLKNSGIFSVTFIISLITAAGFIIGTAAYFTINSYLNSITSNFELVIQLRGNASQADLTDFLISMRNNDEVAEIEYTGPEKGRKSFESEYGISGDALMLDDHFPSIALLWLDLSEFSREKLDEVLKFIYRYDIVEEVNYKKELFDKTIILKEKIINYSLFTGMFFLVLIIIILSGNYFTRFSENFRDHKLYVMLGSGGSFALMPILMNLLAMSAAGVVVAFITFFLIFRNDLLSNEFFNGNFVDQLIIGASGALILEYFIILTIFLIRSRKIAKI